MLPMGVEGELEMGQQMAKATDRLSSFAQFTPYHPSMQARYGSS